jgi:hypothetical protein
MSGPMSGPRDTHNPPSAPNPAAASAPSTPRPGSRPDEPGRHWAPSLPNPMPMSGPAASMPVGMQAGPGVPFSPGVAHAAPADEPDLLGGTLMMDVAPAAPQRTGSHPMIQMPPAGPPPGAFPGGHELDPDEPDNAATLFYQPSAKAPPAGAPASHGPSDAFSREPGQAPVFTYPLDSARAAAAEAAGLDARLAASEPRAVPVAPEPRAVPMAPAARAARAARVWMVIMVGLVLAIAAGALVFLFLGRE